MGDDARTLPTVDTEDREVLGWLEFGDAARQLAAEVTDAGFSPDAVVAIARGGLVLAGAMAYALGIKVCGALSVEHLLGGRVSEAEQGGLPTMLSTGSVRGAKVLLADDVSDSGRTLGAAVRLLESRGAIVRTVCLYSKPWTACVPDVVWRRTDQWVTFPWSALPPVTETL